MTDANIAVSFTASVGDLVSGVAEAKDALASLSQPFGDLNGQYAALGASIGQAFSPSRLQAFDAALNASASLEKSLAAAHAQAAAAMRSGDDAAANDAVTAAKEAISEEVKAVEDGLKQKLALYADEARQHEITQTQKVALSRQALDDEYGAQISALQREAGARRSVAGSEAARRRPDAGRRAASPGPDDVAGAQRGQRAGTRISGLWQHGHASLQFAIARPALGHGELAHRVQERARGPADQVHRMGRGNDRSADRDRGGEDGGDHRRRDRPHRRGAGRRGGFAGDAVGDHRSLNPLVGGRGVRGRVRLSGADHGAVRRRAGDGRAGDGRRHGGRGRFGRHRYVASAAGHADAGPSQRTRDARRAGRGVSRHAFGRRAGERRRSGRRRPYSSDDQFPCFGGRFRLCRAMDEVQQLDDAEGDGRGGAPRRAARPATPRRRSEAAPWSMC